MAARFGVFGLAVMGQNLARNVARNGFPVAVYNRTPARTERFAADYGGEGAFVPAYSPPDLVRSLEAPRPILLMVKAGPPVDEAIDELLPHLHPGDILIDGGNSHFSDTERRARAVEAMGVLYLGAGVSGGEEGALLGPSIMPGGSPEAYESVESVLTRIAASVDGEPCCTYIGPGGAGHYVKMAHNGIEYADMQLIAEAYDLLRWTLGMPVEEIAATFAEWNRGELESYLIQITAEVLAKRDATTGLPLVDVILDEAAQKGTGKWMSQSALDLGTPLSAITEAVFARFLSALRTDRVAASMALSGPNASSADGAALRVEDVRDALYASKIVAYAQGFEQMRMAATEHEWQLDFDDIARIWRAGCIIRARFLGRIRDAYREQPALRNLLLAPYFLEQIGGKQESWRRTIRAAVDSGIAVPAFSSSLAYYDGYRRDRSPACLVQGLRDYFGAHTYKRVDRPGSFHTRWGQDGTEVPA